MKQVYPKMEFFGTNSKDYIYTKTSYLPGGMMSIWQSSIGSYINHFNIKYNDLGCWQAILIKANNRRIICITMYRIPLTTNKGKYSSIAQYNQIRKEVKPTEFY